MKTYIFLCDMHYHPEEHYPDVIRAENLDQALDIWLENENKDREGPPIDKIADADELFGDRITEVIEIVDNNSFNHCFEDGEWKTLSRKILHP